MGQGWVNDEGETGLHSLRRDGDMVGGSTSYFAASRIIFWKQLEGGVKVGVGACPVSLEFLFNRPHR